LLRRMGTSIVQEGSNTIYFKRYSSTLSDHGPVVNTYSCVVSATEIIVNTDYNSQNAREVRVVLKVLKNI